MVEEAERPKFHISSVAAIVAAHPQTLRLYERRGLIKPARSRGKTRLYSERDLERARLIVHLTRNEGVNLAGVAKILELEERIREVEAVVQGWMQQWHERMGRALAARHEPLTAESESSGRAIKVPILRG